MDNRVEIANRPGGRLALFTVGGSDSLNILRNGNVGVRETSPQRPLHVGAGRHISVAQGTYVPGSTRFPQAAVPDEYRTHLLDFAVSIHGGFRGTQGGSNPTGSGSSVNPDVPDGDPSQTVLSGSLGATSAYHVVTILDGNDITPGVTLDGLVVKDGRATRATATSGAYETSGAGVLNLATSTPVLLEGVELQRNIAREFGGAMYIRQAASPGATQMRFCEVTLNTAKRGAGIYFFSGSALEMANCHIHRNGTLAERISPFVPMTVQGGGLYIDSETTVDAANCLMHDNVAKKAGGAVFWLPPNATETGVDFVVAFRNSTITHNSIERLVDPPPMSPLSGAGFHVAPANFSIDPGADDKVLLLQNCIVWGNLTGADVSVFGDGGSKPGIRADLKSTDYRVLDDTSTSSPSPGIEVDADCINANPQFISLASRDFHLLTTSPCIDAGLDILAGSDVLDIDDDTLVSDPLPFDLDLLPRYVDFGAASPAGEIVDMGAYEVQ